MKVTERNNPLKSTFCPNFKVFSFDFREEILSVLKPLKKVLKLTVLQKDEKRKTSAGVKNCSSLKQQFTINFGFTLKKS